MRPMTTSNHQDEQNLEQQPFVSHLVELSHRLKRMLVVVFVIFVCLFPWANDLYTLLAGPLITHLPEGTGMIATKVIAPFLTPLKLTFMLAIFLSIPFLLYQFWAFIAPGLYRHEKRMALPLVASSALLFYMGMAFAYFVVFPLLFDILPSMAPDQITVAPDITDYLDFVLTLFFAFGVAFEVPIATIILVWMGVTTPEALREKRPYIIIGAFCVGMLLTPPDVISQTLLAVPMLILFELGVFFSRGFVRNREEEEPLQPGAPIRDDGDVSPAPKANPEPEPNPGPAGPKQPTPLPIDSPVTPKREWTKEEPDDGEGDATHEPPSEFKPISEADLQAQLDELESKSGTETETEAESSSEFDDWDESDDYYDEGYDDDEPVATEVDARSRVDAKLELVMEYRNVDNVDAARTLLYEVLAEGDEDQIKVARNILEQLDSDYQ